MIVAAYAVEPIFPATDQHPDAVRYQVAGWWVDATGGEPSEAEVVALTSPQTTTPETNGAALDARQRKTAKDEAAALAKSGDYEAAFSKILELI